MFEPQLGKNIEVYIDDMVVKSKVESEHINDLKDIFEILKKQKLHLNASKCFWALALASFWVIWSLIAELRSTLTRLEQLITYNLLRTLKRSRS